MKKRKSNRKEEIYKKYYYVSGLARKGETEYNVGRTICFNSNEDVTFGNVKDKFISKLNEDAFRFMWGWSLIEENN